MRGIIRELLNRITAVNELNYSLSPSQMLRAAAL